MAKSNKSAVVKQVEESVVVEQSVVVERVRPNKDDKGRYKTVDMSMEEIEQRGWKNKSQIIRGLASENFSPSAISVFLGIRYQHVRNVLTQILKKPVSAPAATTQTTQTAVEPEEQENTSGNVSE